MTNQAATLNTQDRHLTRSDRCDRCGAQAFIRVQLPAAGELLFCAHHGKQYEGKLRELAAVIVDETEHLQS